MKLLTLLKMMKTALIDLLGADEMGYAQKMLDEEAWKLEGGEDEVSLKTIQKKTGLSDASGHEPMGRVSSIISFLPLI
ncbi:Protein CBG25932 [Caenorhabditis briggsae]|uniref:Protein CBG25932 n=1 Tax=Caenorhabditis briggsae TaxID=6238 RepID=B6IK64_CAEBR|nr:Protein CBG25932 [Caenorhabditis briggsae]CAS00294.1 Protein CBG25932 [Caenorhabditis briggsae]